MSAHIDEAGTEEFPAGPGPRVLTDEELSALLSTQQFGTLASVRRTGHPHLITVLYGWSPEERVLRISTTTDRLKARWGLSCGSWRARVPWHRTSPRCRRSPTLRVDSLLRLARHGTRPRSLIHHDPHDRPWYQHDPHAALHVQGPDIWSFAVAEGEAEVSEETTEPGDAIGRELLALAPGFDDPAAERAFLAQLVAERRVVIRIRVSRLYGTALDIPG